MYIFQHNSKQSIKPMVNDRNKKDDIKNDPVRIGQPGTYHFIRDLVSTAIVHSIKMKY